MICFLWSTIIEGVVLETGRLSMLVDLTLTLATVAEWRKGEAHSRICIKSRPLECRRKSDPSRSQRNSTVLERFVFCSLAWQTLQRWLALKALKMFMIFSRITEMINILFLYFLTEVALRSRVQLLIYHSPRSIITSSPSILQLCLKKHYSVFKMIELFVTWGESCSYGFCPQELQDSTKKNQNVPRCFKFIFSALQ